MFDLNNFDHGMIDMSEKYSEELEPPPPIFSEEELENAKRLAMKEGIKQGKQQAESQQNQRIAKALEGLQLQISSLVKSEHERNVVFENEVLLLFKSLFESVMPLYYKEYGTSELCDLLKQAIESQQPDKQIDIIVSNEDKDAIETFIEQQGFFNEISLLSDSQFASGHAELKWTHGGSIAHIPQTTHEILSLIQQTLEEKGIKGHDSPVADGIENASPLMEGSDIAEPASSDDRSVTEEG